MTARVHLSFNAAVGVSVNSAVKQVNSLVEKHLGNSVKLAKAPQNWVRGKADDPKTAYLILEFSSTDTLPGVTDFYNGLKSMEDGGDITMLQLVGDTEPAYATLVEQRKISL